MAELEGKLHIATASGQQFDVNVNESDTALVLKAKLRDRMAEGLTDVAPCAAMKLLHDMGIVHDDWVLKDHGIIDGEHLTLVISLFPSGTYKFVSGRGNAPAGRNTSARVQVSFHPEGGFNLSITETEITSITRFPDYDPYATGDKYDHEYSGKATGDGTQIILKVADFQRKGICFRSDPHADLIGEMDSADKIRLQLPFEAGGCNQGKAGLKWISLSSFQEAENEEEEEEEE
mmetsp:Transcript_12980/g.30820  ORF Transcript_12980/g.30820 Transcript_12980/m.30820 type:complete len:233 (-) Transcript_12980:28-726(-)